MSTTVMRCPRCHATREPTASYCPHCHTRRADPLPADAAVAIAPLTETRPDPPPAAPAGPPLRDEPDQQVIVLDSIADPDEPDLAATAAETLTRVNAARRQLRLRIAVAGLITIGLLAAAAQALTAEDLIYQPDTPVRELFTALAERDTNRLADLGTCGLSPLCQPGALAIGYEPPTDIHIDSVATTGGLRRNRATVTVSYRIVDAPQTAKITLERGTGLLRPWRIADPPGQYLDIRSQQLPEVQLAGAQLPATAPDRAPAAPGVWTPPGRYTLTAPTHPLYAVPPTQITASADGDTQTITVPVTIQPSAAIEITRQVHAQLDACAAVGSFNPQVDGTPLSCPFDYTPTDYQPFTDNIRWTITRYPTIQLELTPDGTVTVHTTEPGQAQISYRWTTDVIDPRRWTSASDRIGITVGGSVTTDNRTLTWTG